MFGGRKGKLRAGSVAMGGLDKKASPELLEMIRKQAERKRVFSYVLFAALFVLMAMVGYVVMH